MATRRPSPLANNPTLRLIARSGLTPAAQRSPQKKLHLEGPGGPQPFSGGGTAEASKTVLGS